MDVSSFTSGCQGYKAVQNFVHFVENYTLLSQQINELLKVEFKSCNFSSLSSLKYCLTN